MSKKLYPLYHDGKLDAQSETLLLQIAEGNGKPMSSLTIEEARDSFLEKSWTGIPNESVQVEDIFIENFSYNVPIRIYTPKGEAPFPILVYFHGGGFVLGAVHEFDSFCSYLANGCSCIVVSVDYRLAPEHKYPAAVQDTSAALNWIGTNAAKINGDASRIALAGDSCGANLAVVSSLIARDKGFPRISYQVLICPWVDLLSFDTESYKYFGDGLWLSKDSIQWYRNHYLQNIEQAKCELVSPIYSLNLKELPPALIITAEFDVLRDEGYAFASRLRNSGVHVQYSCYKGMLHDFVTLPGLFDKANKAIDEICVSLCRVFNN